MKFVPEQVCCRKNRYIRPKTCLGGLKISNLSPPKNKKKRDFPLCAIENPWTILRNTSFRCAIWENHRALFIPGNPEGLYLDVGISVVKSRKTEIYK